MEAISPVLNFFIHDSIWFRYLEALFAGVSLPSVIIWIATFLIGTNHFPNVRGKILIFEDINEDIYKIDRMLTYLRMTKKLNEIAGIGFGSFSNDSCDPEWKNLLKNCIIERLQEFDFPILFDLPIGHISGNACIPLGYEATLNGDNGILSIDKPF